MTTIDVKLRLDDDPLLQRECFRCKGTEFRAVTFHHHEGSTYYNPRLSCIKEPYPVGSAESQTAIPLAICLKCKRLVTLI